VIDGHTKIPYTDSSTDTWNVLELADEDPLNSSRILDLYQNRTFTKYGTGNSDYNREHTWPKSYGFPDDGSTNKPYTDCHHLFLCDIEYNNDRANRIFDNCLSGCVWRVADDYNGESGTNYFKDATPIGIWETWIGRKGDCARAMFYMDVRYEGDSGEPDLILTDDPYQILSCATGSNESVAYMGLLEVLLQWHEEDPVDTKEQDRNDAIYTYQHNRNPFIDHPEWVDAIFGDPLSEVPGDLARRDLPAACFTEVAPNPFNPCTRIVFSVVKPGEVQVEIFSLEGRLVRTLLRGHRGIGEHALSWNGTDDDGGRVASGAYFCRLKHRDETDTVKLLLLK
ncbi:MAG: endonuclease, partial [bacterium]